MALGGHFEKTWITKIAQGWLLHTLWNLQTEGLGSSILQRKKLYTPSPGIPPWLPDYYTSLCSRGVANLLYFSSLSHAYTYHCAQCVTQCIWYLDYHLHVILREQYYYLIAHSIVNVNNISAVAMSVTAITSAVDDGLGIGLGIAIETRLHKSRSSRSELEFDLSNFV